VTMFLGLMLPWIMGQGVFAWVSFAGLHEYTDRAEIVRSVPRLVGVPLLLLAGALAGRAAARRLERRQGFAHLRTE
jgi:hypothetical protein